MKLTAPALACLLLVALTALRAAEPAFAIRGTLPWHNFLSGPSAWNESDYRAYLDDLAAKGLNFVAFHCYTGGEERYAPYVEPRLALAPATPGGNGEQTGRGGTCRQAQWGGRYSLAH